MLRELFSHSTCNVASHALDIVLIAHCNFAVVLVTKDSLSFHNPTNKQLALALQLKPSATVWMFLCCKLNADTSKQVSIALSSIEQLDKLHFIVCNITNVDIEILHSQVTAKKYTLTSKIFSSKLNTLIASALAEVDIVCNIEEVIISDNKIPLYCSLTKKLRKKLLLREQKCCQHIC